MLEAFEIENGGDSASATVVLSFEERQKSRHRTRTACGRELGWFVERGRVLAAGDILVCRDGTRVQVEAAQETVSMVESADQLALTRVAYHLGNRHVPLQIESGRLCYLHDHVLDDMVRGLGLAAACVERPFNPENGAYHTAIGGNVGGHAHHHNHEHTGGYSHSHTQIHSHGNSHSHSHSHSYSRTSAGVKQSHTQSHSSTRAHSDRQPRQSTRKPDE